MNPPSAAIALTCTLLIAASAGLAAAPRTDPGVVRTGTVGIEVGALAGVDPGDRLAIDLFADTRVEIEFEYATVRSDTSYTWSGRLAGDDRSWVTLAVEGDVVLADIHSLSVGTFRLRVAADGLPFVEQIDAGALPGCGFDLADVAVPRPSTTASPMFAESGGPCTEDGSVIDLLVVYTDGAAVGAGGEVAMNALIALAVTETNTALANSLVPTTFNLVGTQEVTYIESGGMGTDLARLVDPNDGIMDDVHALRDQLNADVVSLIVNAGDVCGIARLSVGPGPTPLPDQAFNVVARVCATAPTYAFAHELGHNLGCVHDWDSGGCQIGAKPWAQAYVAPGDQFKTIVAAGGVAAPGIPHFSNPDVLFDGVPTGVPFDQPDSADNALGLVSAASVVAGYRNLDCNGNGLCDADEIAGGADDCNANGIPDECEPDCNANGVPDDCDIAGASADANANGLPDECEPAVLYVDASATGAGTGTSWTDAYTELRDANAVTLAENTTVQEIWVAGGTYTPGPAPHSAATFRLVDGVAIYGGFAGGETSVDQRDPAANPTILSGDLFADDGVAGSFSNYEDNSIVIVTGGGTDPTAVIDGFTINGGNNYPATNPCWFTPYGAGGGIHIFNGSPTIRNCTISYCVSEGRGGGLNVLSTSDPLLVNCRFVRNHAAGPFVSAAGGGAMISSEGDGVVMINCSFYGNTSNGGGGGVTNICQDGAFYNCVFSGNTSASTGAGMRNAGSCPNNPKIIGCTFYGNAAEGIGAGVYNNNSSVPVVSNCIFWANTSYGNVTESAQMNDPFNGDPIVNNTALQGWSGTWAGVGNIGDDPLFTDPDGADDVLGTPDDDLRLTASSPCVDTGDDALLPADVADLDGDGNMFENHSYDLDDSPRSVDGDDDGTATVDMGAYEFPVENPCPWDIDTDGTVGISDFLQLLANWGTPYGISDFLALLGSWGPCP